MGRIYVLFKCVVKNEIQFINFAKHLIQFFRDILQLNIIRIWIQFNYFQQYQSRVSGLVGAEQTQRLVNEALVLISLGGNDFVNNYYLVPYSARSRQFSLPDFVNYLIVEYRKILLVRSLGSLQNGHRIWWFNLKVKESCLLVSARFQWIGEKNTSFD